MEGRVERKVHVEIDEFRGWDRWDLTWWVTGCDVRDVIESRLTRSFRVGFADLKQVDR